jgi:hypothetical protein
MLLKDIDEFQVAASPVVFRVQHAHRRSKRQACPLLSIKTAQQENGLVGDDLDSRCGCRCRLKHARWLRAVVADLV